MFAPLETPQFALLRGCIMAAAAFCGTRAHGPMRLRGHFRRRWQCNGMHGSTSAPLQGRLCRWHRANSFGESKVRKADKFRDRTTLWPTSGPSESGVRPRQRELTRLVNRWNLVAIKCGKGERRKHFAKCCARSTSPLCHAVI